MEASKHVNKESRLHVPLMCVVDWRGHRLTAVSLLPIHGAQTLVYGSSDTYTVHVNPVCKDIVSETLKKLGLKEHKVGKNEVLIHGPVDLEVHHGFDGRYAETSLAALSNALLFPSVKLLLFGLRKVISSNGSVWTTRYV
jgi:hypothetical protein